MARYRSIMNRRARRRGRVVGLGAAMGAVLALGMTPLATAPAKADLVDAVIDELLAPFMDAATGSFDWDAVLSPAAWDAFLDPAHWDAVLADVSGGVEPVAAMAGAAGSDPTDWTAWFQQSIYTPIHDGIEGWINSDLGQQVDGVINQPFMLLTGRGLIGDGADGTAVHPNGFDGGWLFGDGGAGWDSTHPGIGGGDGGAAGMFGDGGTGGDGGAGIAGGAGGAGGSLMGIGGAGGDGGAGAAGVVGGVGGAGGAGGAGDGWLFGVGGHGGAGGDGTEGGNGGDGGDATGLFGSGGDGGAAGDSDDATPGDLPALGGAGGNGGLLGSHGAVGHFGTLAGVPPSGSSDLSTTGSWITDSDGRVVILHGLNQVFKVPPFEPSADGFSADDAAFLAANGFNAVRVGVIWAGVEPEPGIINYAYLASIEQTVQTLADHGIVSILDMHQDLYSSTFGGEGAAEWATQTGGLPNPDFGFPATYFLNPAENNAWDAFWSNADAPDGVGLENHYAQMMEAVANYFKDDPGVVGYEIMNEPWAGSQTLNSLLGSPFFEGQQLTPFYNQVDAAIRAVDPTTPVYFEPTTLFGSLPVSTHLGTVDDPNTVFSFHNYCITTSLIPTASFGCDLNADVVMNNAEAYAQAHDIPALNTEFGATNTIPTITAGMNAANQHLFGWTEWAYTGNDITSSSPNDQALVFDPSQPPVGDNVNTDKLAALAEPYPQAIAGTPNSWSFDNGTFQLSYSTEQVDGDGSFPAGTQTTISVPKIEYPDGYQVSVTGGHVVSGAGAPVLVIASNPGADTVTVTVTPAAGGATAAG